MADALSPSIYAFHSHSVRIVMRDGEPWFVATDVASALGYSSPKDAAEHLDADEKGSATTRTPGGDQKVTVINESGLYALVLRSRKPEARKFAKWVTSEVLPSIRKTGRYEAGAMPAQPTLRGRRWLIETDAHGVETVQPIGQDDFIANWSRLVKDIASGECLRSSAELVNMANACTARLQHRMNQDASRANAALFRQTAPSVLVRA